MHSVVFMLVACFDFIVFLCDLRLFLTYFSLIFFSLLGLPFPVFYSSRRDTAPRMAYTWNAAIGRFLRRYGRNRRTMDKKRKTKTLF